MNYTGVCVRCGKWWDEHPGGFCPDAVWPDGTIEIATAPMFEAAADEENDEP